MLYIHSTGHFHPDNVIDNRFLEHLDIGTGDEWILARTGIRTRRTLLPLEYICATRNRDPRASDEASLYTNAETGHRAARMALERAGLSASDLGMVIAGGCAPRSGAPAEACLIADRLGIAVPCLDLNAACATFGAQLHMLSMMDAAALPDFVLVVNPDNLTRTVDYSNRQTAVLIGDCTSAAIISRRVPARARVRRTFMDCDPSGCRKVSIPAIGHLRQDGPAVQNFAIRKTVATIDRLRQHACRDFYFVGHQANLMMLRSACARAGVEESLHLYNVDVRGNCGAAGAPSVLSERWEGFRPGDQALLAMVGAGLTWAGMLLEFRGGSVQ
jgi:3-oxoacyl-[acyl-carrier-protein] synthase-3